MDGSIKNINDLIEALGKLKKDEILANNNELYEECRDVFKRLGYLKVFDPNDVPALLITLKNLPEELKIVNVGELKVNAEKLESKTLDKQDLDSLIKDYEEAKDEAVKRVYEQEIFKRTGEENVDQFIKGQKEIAERNKKNLEVIEKIDPKLKGEIETKLKKVEQGMEEVKAKKIEDMVLEEKDYKKKELEKEVQKIVNDKEKAREISQEIIRERAEIKVVKGADEMATKMCEELKNEQVVVTEKTRIELRENILKSWEDGNKLVIPQKITEATQSKASLEKINIICEKFKNENLETIVNYRAEQFKKEVTYELRNNILVKESENAEVLRKGGIGEEEIVVKSREFRAEKEKRIKELVEVAAELKYSTERIFPDVDSETIIQQIYANQQQGKKFEVQPENAVEESKEIANYLSKSQKIFNSLVDQYAIAKEKLGLDNLPQIKKLRVTDKLMGIFKEGSQARNWINGAQRMMGFVDKINNFPANLLAKLGVQDFGLKIIGKIGGEAAATFVKNAAAVIAEQGTVQGIKSIFLGIIGKGTAAAGGSGALASAVAAFQALPVAGQIIAVVVAVVLLLKPILDKINNWFKEHLNINLAGAKDFLENTLNLGKGGIIALMGGLTVFFSGLPMMLIGIGPLIGIVFVSVILFTTGCTMSNQQMASTLVPPADNGNCVLKSEYNGQINCNPNAPINNVSGLNKSSFVDVAKRWKDGTNYSDTCYNDTVNRALCKGINPAYALWAWLHESGASNYTGANDIEDFGMHSITENEDFNAQINAFLEIDPAKGCINDSRIGGDYWLAFSAAYLNGKNDCDPDKKNAITGMTPREYEKELKSTWNFVSSAPMPDSIYTTAAGKNCDTAFQAYYNGNASEFTDTQGRVWVCTENTQEGDDTDPNTPGLDGVIVDGECSVGDVVVPTKQCDSQWGQVTLPGTGTCSNGKPGTICSAGCGPTSVSMMFRHVNGSLTPKNIIYASGSAYSNMSCSGSSLEQAQEELVKKFGSSAVTYNDVTKGCDEKAIAKWVCDGKVVMVLSNFYRNSKLELGGHYVLAVGVSKGKIVVRDPFYSATETPFDGTKAYGYAHDIKACLLVDKTAIK